MRKVHLNQAPGSLNYTGQYVDQPMELTLITYDETTHSVSSIENIDHIKGDKRNKWLNVTGLNDLSLFTQLKQLLGVDLLVLEDVVHVSQRSKIEVFNQYSFSILKMVKAVSAEKLTGEHLSMLHFPNENLIITFQETEGDVFDSVRERLSTKGTNIRSKGVDYLYYALLDAVVDHQIDAFQTVQIKVDQIEREIFEKKQSLEALYKWRRELLNLKSASQPLGDILEVLMKDNQWMISSEVKHFLRDVSDHQKHLVDQILNYREIVSGLYDLYQSNINSDMNQVMKTLTMFSAMFIPLSFLSGFFGMNFTHFNMLKAPNGIPIFIGFSVICVAGMFYYFKRKDWL